MLKPPLFHYLTSYCFLLLRVGFNAAFSLLQDFVFDLEDDTLIKECLTVSLFANCKLIMFF